MKKVLFVIATLALFVGCYYVTCYVNVFLGLFAIGLSVNIIDKLQENLL